MLILNAAEMKRAEHDAIASIGVTSLDLMERAGASVVDVISEYYPAVRRVVVLCGKGNNGGDGWVVARLLHARGLEVLGVAVGYTEAKTGDAAVCFAQAVESGVTARTILDTNKWREFNYEEAQTIDLVVDALLGTGLNGPLQGLLFDVVRHLMDPLLYIDKPWLGSKPIVSIDVPTGLSSDTCSSPETREHAIQAELTVTFVAPKYPHLFYPACKGVGKLVTADIGIPLPDHEQGVEECVYTEQEDLYGPHDDEMPENRSCFFPKDIALVGHKGDRGRITIVAGSNGKTGAAQLAGMGALRGGAGLVTVATPMGCVAQISHIPEYMTLAMPERDGMVNGKGLDAIWDTKPDVIAIGPGLGTGRGPELCVREVLEDDRYCERPLVLDADALNVLATQDGIRLLRDRKNPGLIITPHPGEFSRLTGLSISEIQRDRITAAREFAKDVSAYVVLKGAQTVLATPDGDAYINSTGNPGMATGGSGDVLTGVISAYVGRVPVFELDHSGRVGSDYRETVRRTVQHAIYAHGLAGDLAAADLGMSGVIASDIANYLGRASREMMDRN